MADKFSVFRITLNSNKCYDTITDEQKAKIKKIAKYIFSNHIKKYLECNSIKKLETYYRFELSKNNRLVHLHGSIIVSHQSKCKMDYSELRNVINTAFEENVYLNIVASGSPEKAWMAYVNKGSKTRKTIDL